MIGGDDIVLPTNGWKTALCVVSSDIARAIWPMAVFEDANSDCTWDDVADIPFGRCRELFVYRNHCVKEAADELGITEELRPDFLHLLLGPNSLTVVVSNASDPEAGKILEVIRRSLESQLVAAMEPRARAA